MQRIIKKRIVIEVIAEDLGVRGAGTQVVRKIMDFLHKELPQNGLKIIGDIKINVTLAE